MSKFNTATTRTATAGPITAEQTPSGVTHEGAPGYARDTKSELFLLAVANMVREDTFYEGSSERDGRFRALVHNVAVSDPDWLTRMIGWLRRDANMRSAALVAAAEMVKGRLDAGLHGESRQAVDAALQRADEPGEILAYWRSQYGRAIPKPLKRGVADAVVRLYSERSLGKYDTNSKGYRFGDVVELVHPQASGWQGELFKHALDRRHNRDEPIPEALTMLRARAALMDQPAESRRASLRPETLAAAGMTWESLAGWLQGPLDAAAWESVIPSMGYMALLRNLRNFDEAGVSDVVAEQVAKRLADPEQVAKSRQLPMRFLSAYRAAPSLRWAWALEQALGHSLASVPVLRGRTLILVDRSGSMFSPLSARSDLTRADAAAIFGSALALRCEAADLVEFGTTTRPIHYRPGESVLRMIQQFTDLGGTDTARAVRQHFADHTRVVIVTDEQADYYGGDPTTFIAAQVPVYTWNLAGYQYGHGADGVGRYTFGGLSDAAFRMIPLLEAGQSASWPF